MGQNKPAGTELGGPCLPAREVAGNHNLGLHLAGAELAGKGRVDLLYENSSSR
jgi:hypothetical protein